MKKFYADIVLPKVDRYIADIYPKRDGLFLEMEKHAERFEFPLVGPLVGRFLSQICLIYKPNKILELGSGFGYSALWFAISMEEGAKITCTDYSEENGELAKNYFSKANQLDKLIFLAGNSVELIKGMDENYDLIFNDVDKEYYPELIDLAYERLNTGGVFISDNALWYGKVADEDNDLPSTIGIKEYNSLLFSKKGFFSTLIPIRDGISISVKVG